MLVPVRSSTSVPSTHQRVRGERMLYNNNLLLVEQYSITYPRKREI